MRDVGPNPLRDSVMFHRTTPHRPAASVRRRITRSGAVVLAAACILLGLVLVSWAIPSGKFAAVGPAPTISLAHLDMPPERQVEPHTCGFHALSWVYRSHGVSPDARALRTRLGVDAVSLVYDRSSTGTLHPDMYRVMDQDGFLATAMRVGDADHLRRFRHHLACGHSALGLIVQPDSGIMHWVVLNRLEGDSVTVVDSMKPEPHTVSLDEWWRQRLISAVMVHRRDGPVTPIWRLHGRGLGDMFAAFGRSREFGTPVADRDVDAAAAAASVSAVTAAAEEAAPESGAAAGDQPAAFADRTRSHTGNTRRPTPAYP